MQIGLIANTFLPEVGGLQWKVHHLAEQYSSHGHDVTVFANRPYLTLKSIPLTIPHSYKLIRSGYPVSGFGYFGISKRMFIRSIIKQHFVCPFDVLHCHHLGLPTEIGLSVKSVSATPVVATPCGHDIQTMPEINYGARLNSKIDKLIRNNLKAVDLVTSISTSVRAEIEELNPSAKIIDIPNGVAWQEFQLPPNKSLHKSLGLCEDNILLMSLGACRPIKGYEYAIRAFAKIARDFGKVHYVLVGRDMPLMQPLLDELDVSERVSLLPEVPMTQVPNLMRSASIFISPSLLEGFSQVNVQAMASGLPCVLSDVPGNQDLGKKGGALLVSPGKIDDIAVALQILLLDQPKMARLGQEAHNISREYAWDNIALEFLSLFESLMTPSYRYS